MELFPSHPFTDYYYNYSTEEVQIFLYYHSLHLQNDIDQFPNGVPDPSYYVDSDLSSSPEYDHCQYSPPFIPDTTFYPQAVQGSYETFDEYSHYTMDSGYYQGSLPYASQEFPGECYTPLPQNEPFYGEPEAGPSVPLPSNMTSTYPEPRPHLTYDDQAWHDASQIHLDPSLSMAGYISPAQCHEPTTSSHRHHPYLRSSQRLASESPERTLYTEKSKGKTRVSGKTSTKRSSRSRHAGHLPHYDHAVSRGLSYPQEQAVPYTSTTASLADTTTNCSPSVSREALTVVSFDIDRKPTKKRRRRDAVNLACYFCRRRKIACNQPPADSLDRSCGQCRSRGVECEYPKESRRGMRRLVCLE